MCAYRKMCGSLTGKEIRNGLDQSIIRKIFDALKENWVITFSQGSTKPFASGGERELLIH